MTFDIIEAVRLEHLKGNKPNYIIEIEEGANMYIRTFFYNLSYFINCF